MSAPDSRVCPASAGRRPLPGRGTGRVIRECPPIAGATVATTETASILRLLSLGFTRPSEESLAQLDELACGLLESGSPPPEIDELYSADWGLLPGEYERLFEEDRCIYEGTYEGDAFRLTRLLDRLSAFYRAFGADTAGAGGDHPDHVAAELAFLAHLARRQLAAASAGERVVCRGAEDVFLLDHLGRWFPAFCRRTIGRASGFYAALARLGERTIVEGLARGHLEPSRAQGVGGRDGARRVGSRPVSAARSRRTDGAARCVLIVPMPADGSVERPLPDAAAGEEATGCERPIRLFTRSPSRLRRGYAPADEVEPVNRGSNVERRR